MPPEDYNVTLGGGTGLVQYSGLPALPTRIEFLGSQEGSASDAAVRWGEGVWDNNTGFQRADATFGDANSNPFRTVKETDRCFIMLDRNGSNVDRKIDVEGVSMDNLGGGDFGFTLDQHAMGMSVQARLRIYY